MIDEAQGDSPEDAPAPPASTRWAEDPVQDEGGFAPPYVPGRETAAPEASSGEPTSGEPASADATSAAPETEATSADVSTETGAPETAGSETSFPFDAQGDDDFPFDEFNLEGEAEAAVEEEAPAEEYEAAGTMGWSPADLEEEERGAAVEDDAEPPMESIPEAELVPIVDDPFAEEDLEAQRAAESSGAGAVDSVGEAAALLDRLARTLRDEGEEALRREMDSPDRLTALLSGLVAGYLSGRS